MTKGRSTRRLAMAGAALGLTLTACGGAPSDSTETSESAMKNCSPDNPCGGGSGGGSGGGTRPHVVRTWSYNTVATQMCPNTPAAPIMAVNEQISEDTVMSNTTDPVDQIALVLMQSYGCSTPIRWSTYRPYSTYPGTPGICAPPNGSDYDFAYAHMQLCPYSASLANYVNARGYPTRGGECHGADTPSHLSWSACDSYLPQAPANYVWAITSMDPTCGSAGCMVQTTGGPEQW